MTGFGAGRATVEGEELSVELRSLNHKFCEVKPRLPRELAALDGMVAKAVKDKLARGAVEVWVKRTAATQTGVAPQVDLALAREYRRAFSQLAAELKVADDVQLRHIASQPGVIHLEERSVQLDHATAAFDQAMTHALAQLLAMREKEGEAIRADLASRLTLVEKLVAEVKALAPKAVEEYRARLEARIAELAKGVPLDPQRIAQEVAFFAERTDIAEEMTRLSSHLEQFRALFESPEPAGRKMDFIVQEMHREVNTTGSKSQHPEISTRVVALKAELERVREQVQNVE